MKTQEQIDIRVAEARRAIEKHGQYISYRADGILSFEDIERICEPFRGTHHAKINYFADGRRPYQCFIIQKERFNTSREGRMVRSEILF